MPLRRLKRSPEAAAAALARRAYTLLSQDPLRHPDHPGGAATGWQPSSLPARKEFLNAWTASGALHGDGFARFYYALFHARWSSRPSDAPVSHTRADVDRAMNIAWTTGIGSPGHHATAAAYFLSYWTDDDVDLNAHLGDFFRYLDAQRWDARP
jgi:hypothetical protein